MDPLDVMPEMVQVGPRAKAALQYRLFHEGYAASTENKQQFLQTVRPTKLVIGAESFVVVAIGGVVRSMHLFYSDRS